MQVHNRSASNYELRPGRSDPAFGLAPRPRRLLAAKVGQPLGRWGLDRHGGPRVRSWRAFDGSEWLSERFSGHLSGPTLPDSAPSVPIDPRTPSALTGGSGAALRVLGAWHLQD